MVEGDPLNDDPPWEVKSVEVEEAEEHWMVVEEVVVVEEVDDLMEEVAYSWSCLRRSDGRNFDAGYLYETDDENLSLTCGKQF